MKSTTRCINIFFIIVLAGTFLFFSSCSKKGLKLNISKPLNLVDKVDTDKMTKDDYYGEGIVLAGIRLNSFEGNLCMVPFYKSTIKQAASKETKNEALIETFDGKEYWTKYIVYKSKPAKKEDLKVGTFIIVCGDNYGKSFKDLEKTNTWGLRKVKDLSELYKSIVNLEFYDTYWNTWKKESRHINNIRIIEGEFNDSL